MSHEQSFHAIAQRLLIGLSVITRYNNKMYRIDEILFDMNPLSTFDCQGESVSYVDYYKKRYNIDIIDKEQPMLLNRLIILIYIYFFLNHLYV